MRYPPPHTAHAWHDTDVKPWSNIQYVPDGPVQITIHCPPTHHQTLLACTLQCINRPQTRDVLRDRLQHAGNRLQLCTHLNPNTHSAPQTADVVRVGVDRCLQCSRLRVEILLDRVCSRLLLNDCSP